MCLSERKSESETVRALVNGLFSAGRGTNEQSVNLKRFFAIGGAIGSLSSSWSSDLRDRRKKGPLNLVGTKTTATFSPIFRLHSLVSYRSVPCLENDVTAHLTGSDKEASNSLPVTKF